jgi:4-methylaminobutanoate oxidase (formaldehyde-forming)
VTREHVLSGRYELEVAAERVPCAVTLSPLHDPEGLRLRA